MRTVVPYQYRQARSEDLIGVARVFADAFPESIAHYFDRPPALKVVAEPFALCLAAEPEAFFVAVAAGGEIAGYIFAPSQTSRLARVALLRGFACRWLWRWVTGQYRIGAAPVRALAANKLDFWANACSREGQQLAAEARILSVAVHSGHRGQGVAGALCGLGLARLDRLAVRPVRLEVRPWNAAAMAVYSRMGFWTAGRAQDSQGDWLIMLR